MSPALIAWITAQQALLVARANAQLAAAEAALAAAQKHADDVLTLAAHLEEVKKQLPTAHS